MDKEKEYKKMREAEQREAEREQRIKALLNSFVALSNTGEEELAQQIEQKLLKEVRFVEKKDWMNHTFCSDFPIVDKKSVVFCCPPSKKCIYRYLVLKKLGLNHGDYKKLKTELAKTLIKNLKKNLAG